MRERPRRGDKARKGVRWAKKEKARREVQANKGRGLEPDAGSVCCDQQRRAVAEGVRRRWVLRRERLHSVPAPTHKHLQAFTRAHKHTHRHRAEGHRERVGCRCTQAGDTCVCACVLATSSVRCLMQADPPRTAKKKEDWLVLSQCNPNTAPLFRRRRTVRVRVFGEGASEVVVRGGAGGQRFRTRGEHGEGGAAVTQSYTKKTTHDAKPTRQ